MYFILLGILKITCAKWLVGNNFIGLVFFLVFFLDTRSS
jgi:hypothetical protein